MYDDEVDTIIQKKMFDQLIHTHPIKDEITGAKADISQITVKDLERAFKHFYTTDRRQLLILGPIDVDVFKEALLNYDSKIIPTPHPEILPNNEPGYIKIDDQTYHLDMNVGVFNVGIKYTLNSRDESKLFKTEILMLFLMRMLYGGSSIFHEQMSDLKRIIDEFNFNVILEDETLIFYDGC